MATPPATTKTSPQAANAAKSARTSSGPRAGPRTSIDETRDDKGVLDSAHEAKFRIHFGPKPHSSAALRAEPDGSLVSLVAALALVVLFEGARLALRAWARRQAAPQ